MRYRTRTGFVAAIALMANTMLGCSKDADRTGSNGVPVAELISEYAADRFQADAKYEGKRIRVTGTVENATGNESGDATVFLGSGKSTDADMVLLKFRKEHAPRALSLTVGTETTADCEVAGRIGFLVLDGCALL